MDDVQRMVFAFALEHGTVLFPLLGLAFLAVAVLFLVRRGRWRWAHRSAAILCVGLVVLCGFAYHFTRSVNAALVRRVGDFSFRLVSDDSPHRLSDYRGKPVVLNFWATWCAPCLAELPDLEQLARRRQDVVVLTVSDESRDVLQAAVPGSTARVNGYFADLPPDDGIGKMAYQGRPTTLVIGDDGQVTAVLIGAQTLAAFESALAHR